MRGAIPALTQYSFMAWCLVKHREKFTFTSLETKLRAVYFPLECFEKCVRRTGGDELETGHKVCRLF
jgi:hypothetical protein